MKKVLSFALAVALAFSLLLGSAFASSGVTVVAPDTFISWGSVGDLTSLAVPSDAVSDGRRYIIYQVRDWVVSYFRVRFVIDSFSRGDVVEGETLSWTRYTGEWGLGVNAALEPSSYEVEYHAAEEYTYSQNFLHLPVKSNFDYYDANGELIISGSGYVNDFEGLMDLTFTDGTVIQVPRRLVGNQFVVVRNSLNADIYKIWNFGSPDTLDGIYEGAEGVNYSTSVGTFVSGGQPENVLSFYDEYADKTRTVDMSTFPVDVSIYPYVIVRFESRLPAMNFYCTSSPQAIEEVNTDRYKMKVGAGTTMYAQWQPSGKKWNTPSLLDESVSVYIYSGDDGNVVQHNYDLYDGSTLIYPSTFSFDFSTSSWTWDVWQSSSAALGLTYYGDIVYQTFDYPLSNPDDEPSESPDPEPSPSPGGTPDDSNNGLFAWLKMQWVFLLQKLQNIVDAIKNLAVDLDPYPDKTKPLLDDFFTNIFDNGIGEDDVAGLGGVLQNVRPWFKTDFKLGDLWDLFDEDYMTSWFTDETRIALDSTGGELNS